MARWRNDPRGGTDPLYDATAAEVKPPKASYPISPVRFMAWAAVLAIFATLLGAFMWISSTVTERTIFNWMDGYGFTPISHPQSIAPVSFTPASVTWTLPGEVAKR